jgi:AcrR family transcriptional regulator
MRAIAERAGVALGNTYYYFRSKEHLIQAFYARSHAEHLAAAAPVLAGFATYEWRKTQRDGSPLLVMTLFLDRAFVAGILMAFTLFAAVFSFFFVITLYLQFGEDFSGAGTGLTVAPFATGVLMASIVSPRLARRIGRRVLRLGALGLACAMAAMALVCRLRGPAGLHGYELALPLLLGGLGYGCILAPLLNIMLAGVRNQGIGSASGVYTTSQQIGGSVGVAVIGVIFFRLLSPSELAALAGGPAARLLFSQALSAALLFNVGLAIALFFLVGLLPALPPVGARTR